MIFDAYIDADPAEVISCRVFSPSRRQWWEGKDSGGNDIWGPDSEALLQPLPSVGSSLHAGPVEYPEYGVSIEYLLEGDPSPIGKDEIPVPAPAQEVTLSGEDKTEISAAIAAGVTPNLPTPFLIPLVTGTPASVNLIREKRFTIKRGNTFTLPLSLGRDCRGALVRFAGKIDPKKPAYDMPLREVTFIDPATGTGYVELDRSDTAQVATVFGEVQYHTDTDVLVLESYTFRIVQNIIDD